jgi:hypothetical protein
VLTAYRRQITHPGVHVAAIALFAVGAVATILHYLGLAPGNPLTWSAWIAAVAAYAASFARRPQGPPSLTISGVLRSEPVLAVVILVIYAITHLWNNETAPWNSNGLFDDAAWDIYFARSHAFSGPFQAAFYDPVGAISRETVFHYFITSFFKLFGYNLVVFNAALLVLGAVTTLFTALTVHRLLRNPTVTLASALILSLLPLHFVHVFVGHRYAIAAPLMMVSLYFLYSGFRDRSFPRTVLSAFFAALCVGSAIMGMQVLLALLAAAIVIPIIDRRRSTSAENRAVALAWIVAFVISAMPLLLYVAFNPVDYFRREQGLLTDFVGLAMKQGYDGIRPFVDQLGELFFAPDTFRRMWLHAYPIIPWADWLLLVPGLLIALRRRRMELVLLAGIPVASALVAGAFDFRILLAAPIWVVMMAYALDASSLGRTSPGPWRPAIAVGAVIVLVLGLVPSAQYLLGISVDSHAQYLLSHRDVAVSRLIQDVVAGAQAPSGEMKPDEFDRVEARSELPFDSLACAERAYAVAHLYLQAFNDRRILAMCEDGNQALIGKDRLFAANAKAIAAYQPRGKALKLIWEESEVASDALRRFAELERYGAPERFAGSVDGERYAIRVLTIPADRITDFQQALAGSAGVRP